MGKLIELHKTFNEEQRKPGEWDKEKESLVVIANDDQGNGCMLWWAGWHITNELEQVGISQLCDFGLDDAPHGISVWQGKYVYFGDGDDVEAKPRGIFRSPTFEEWAAIIAGVNPWRSEEWRIK
jgi:hypothetical protein